MRIGLLFLLIVSSLAFFTAHAEVYRWVDTDGSVVYGDNPPKKSKAKPIELPGLTEADSYTAEPAQAPATPAAATLTEAKPETPTAPTEESDAATESYSDFKITSPATGETIRSNNAEVGINIALTPTLKKGDGITVYLDSKQAASAEAQSFLLPAVEPGEHTLFAVLNDPSGNIIQNTETVKFTILRH